MRRAYIVDCEVGWNPVQYDIDVRAPGSIVHEIDGGKQIYLLPGPVGPFSMTERDKIPFHTSV